MFCMIELVPKTEIPDGIEDLLWEFLCSLMRNGQILRDYTIVKNGNYCLAVTLPKPDSFDEAYDGPYVRRDRNRLREIFDFRMNPMGENVNSAGYCNCKSRSAIEMQTFRNDTDSPLLCCDCGRAVALYEIPLAENEEDHCALMHWQDNYSAMDLLWMRGLCDRYAHRQLVNPDSALNRQGIGLARKLEACLGVKLYYNMFDDRSKQIKRAKSGEHLCRICPCCGDAMRYARMPADFERDVCDACGLSSDRA